MARSPSPRRLFLRLDTLGARRARGLHLHPLGARTVGSAMGPAPVVLPGFPPRSGAESNREGDGCDPVPIATSGTTVGPSECRGTPCTRNQCALLPSESSEPRCARRTRQVCGPRGSSGPGCWTTFLACPTSLDAVRMSQRQNLWDKNRRQLANR
jgi:hypothetical protein